MMDVFQLAQTASTGLGLTPSELSSIQHQINEAALVAAERAGVATVRKAQDYALKAAIGAGVGGGILGGVLGYLLSKRR